METLLEPFDNHFLLGVAVYLKAESVLILTSMRESTFYSFGK